MTFDDLAHAIGTTLGPTEWLTIEQDRIDAFAATTGDRQWIHVDRERAAAGPFGTTIAHGYLTLSLIAPAHFELAAFPETGATIVNYGLEKVRFVSPVRCGARVRTHIDLAELADRRGGRSLLRTRSTIEIEGEAKPALMAEALFLLIAEG
ncbi:MAG: MaoC family dehydratase [Trueperaceae bacterium]|nr:MaoC family dehydratase [Trueperaceae bacterium]